MQFRYHISASFQYYDTHSKKYVLYTVHKLLTLALILHISCIFISFTNLALLVILVFVVVSSLDHVQVFYNSIECSLQGSFFPWDFPGKNTGVAWHFLFQGIFPTQGSKSCLLFWEACSLPADNAAGKESACNAGDPLSIYGLGRSPREGIGYPYQYSWASLVAQMVKNLPAM